MGWGGFTPSKEKKNKKRKQPSGAGPGAGPLQAHHTNKNNNPYSQRGTHAQHTQIQTHSHTGVHAPTFDSSLTHLPTHENTHAPSSHVHKQVAPAEHTRKRGEGSLERQVHTPSEEKEEARLWVFMDGPRRDKVWANQHAE